MFLFHIWAKRRFNSLPRRPTLPFLADTPFKIVEKDVKKKTFPLVGNDFFYGMFIAGHYWNSCWQI
jgi:hypothetical protein